MKFGWFFTLAVVLAATACSGPGSEENTPDGGSNTVAPDGGNTGHPDGGGNTTPDGGTTTPDGGTADVCGFNHFNHPLGYACNRDADCESGLCFREEDPFGGPGRAYCSQECEQDSDCPDGFTCDSDGTGATVCMADPSGDLLPGDHSLKLGAPCSQSADCIDGAVCAQARNPDGVTVSTFCAPACDKADANSCGSCGTCEDFNTGGDAPQSFCVPKGPKKDGEKCDSHYDCGTFICVGFCTEVCGGSTGVKCAGGTSCQQVDDTTSICIDPAQKGATAIGGACAFDFECASGAKCLPDANGENPTCRTPAAEGETCTTTADCASNLRCLRDQVTGDRTCEPPGDIGGNCAADSDCVTGLTCNDLSDNLKACTKPCTAGCGTGNACGVVDMDTMIRLYNTDTATAANPSGSIARNDDIDFLAGELWSRLSMELAPGTYWISVEAYKKFIGSYKLAVTVAGQSPKPAIELPESPVRNDDAATAQEILDFPFEVSATMDGSADVDFFKFTVPGTAPVVVTFETGPGEASVCLPTSKLAQTPVGGACAYNGYCASGVCEIPLKACGQACSTDADCGSGFACADIDTHKTCVPAGTVGVIAWGKECHFSYECADHSCVTFLGSRMCYPRCEDPSFNCGQKNECAEIPQTVGGQSTTVKACVPEGDKTGAFNTSCVRLSDCAPDLLCTDGVCSKQCGTDADCPGQNFPGTLPAGSNACKACTSWSDCGADGDCVDGVGFEKFCADACDAAGKCPGGFHCEDGFFGSYCIPDTGTCRRPVCQVPQGQTAGLCAVPSSDFAELCSASGQCTTNNCAGGLCTKSCAQDSDCGCSTGDLICSQNTCQRSPAFTSEAEPNDTSSTAQALPGLPTKLFGSFVGKAGGVRDADYYSIGLKAGDTVTVTTRPVCGTAAPSLDTAVTLYLNGNSVAEDDFFDNYGVLAQYTAAADGTYVIEVKDDSFGAPKDGMYVLEVTK